jgi:Ca2+/Na+ antiporter
MTEQKLGKLIGVYGIAPAYLQRTVIVAVFSFLFFLITTLMFSWWQNFLYFFLATAFLIVYLLTMFGWFMLRKNILKIYENGMSYRKFAARWDEIEAVETKSKSEKINCEIRKTKGEKIVLSDSIYEVEKAIGIIESKVKN